MFLDIPEFRKENKKNFLQKTVLKMRSQICTKWPFCPQRYLKKGKTKKNPGDLVIPDQFG